MALEQEVEALASSESNDRRKLRRRSIVLTGLLVIVALCVLVPLLLRDKKSPSATDQQMPSLKISTTPTSPSNAGPSSPRPPATTTEKPAYRPTAFTSTSPTKLLLGNESSSAPEQQQPPSVISAVSSSASTPPPRSSIVLGILPDSQYSTEGSPYVFKTQVEWLRDHHDELGHPFIIHVGDIVQSPRVLAQWESAALTMVHNLDQDKSIQYSMSSGNHDIGQSGADDIQRANDANELYLKYFGPKSGRSTAGRDSTGWSEYHLANVQGVELLVLATDWRVSSGTASWARDVLKAHSGIPAVLVSHEFLTPYDSGGSSSNSSVAVRTAYGDYLWKELVENENQIFLVICGHIDGSGWRVDSNSVDQPVLQILVNYQEHTAGGNGYTRLMELDFVRNSVQQFTFSPWVQKLWRDEGLKALAPHDIAVLDNSNNNYVVSMNFTNRFASMGAEVPSELMQQPGVPWLETVRSELDQVPLPNTSPPPPADVYDYPEVPDTAAHWRFDNITTDQATVVDVGQPMPADVLIPDLSGRGNHLYRQDTIDSLPEYLVTSSSHHPLSASKASLCFVNPNRTVGGYLTTIDTAPLNHTTFTASGYTVEAFVKLHPAFLDDSLPYIWTGIVARVGHIYDVFDDQEEEMEGDINEPLAVLGVSNLAEMQFASWPIEQQHDGEYKRKLVTAWSSPLALDTWYHVAAVNDGYETRLYVDGWPARRDPVYDIAVAGLVSAGQGWIVGASFYADNTKVFGGCIGEVRIAERALTVDDFLLSRRNTSNS